MGLRGPKPGTKYRSPPGPKPRPKVEKPRIRITHGIGTCLFCKVKFERTRQWSKYCSGYCRMMHWHMLNTRKLKPGTIVERDGVPVDVPIFDPNLEVAVEAEVARRLASTPGKF